MVLCIILICVAVICLAIYLYEKIKEYSLKMVFIKAIVSLLFVAVGLYNSLKGFDGGDTYKIFIVLGLAFGLAGDIFLDLKYVYPDHDDVYTYLGFITFALGHVSFISGMIGAMPFKINLLYYFIPVILACGIATLILILEKPMKLVFGEMKVIVFIYSVFLFSMPLYALFFSIYSGFNNPFLIMMMIGGVLFAISDLILSQTYFGSYHEKPIDFVLNYLFYYSAQFVIAMSLFF